MEALVPLLVVVPLGAAFAVVALANLPNLARRRSTGEPPPADGPSAGGRALSLLACGAVLANLIIALVLLQADVGRIYVGGWGDAKTALGSRNDRHAAISKGNLGLETIHAIVRDERFSELPKLVELHNEDNLAEVGVAELRRLRETAKL